MQVFAVPRPGGNRRFMGHVLVASFLVAASPACHGEGSTAPAIDADAVNADLDAAATDGPRPARPEVQVGFVSGTSCQASSQCLSGACTLGVCSDWAHVMSISIDATPTGANLAGPVSNFPLLLRFDRANFRFDDAREDGADLRFLDSDGHSLSHQIERWDGDEKVGVVWVRVPTVAAGGSKTTILMYYGNRVGADISSGPDVFSDYGCVLHMVTSPDTEDQLADASGKGNTGIPMPQGKSEFHDDGVAGAGFFADGVNSFVASRMPLPAPTLFSASMWFRTTSTAGGGLLAFSPDQTSNGALFSRAVWMDTAGRLHFGVMEGSQLPLADSPSSYNDGFWHLLVAQLSATEQRLVIDGQAVGTTTAPAKPNVEAGYWRFGAAPITGPGIMATLRDRGATASSAFLVSTIDEARISAVQETDDWLRLTFATQRPGATVITYQPVP
jgi:hypothetical protein